MLKVSLERIEEMELQHPGTKETIFRFENADLPECPYCGTNNTADVQVGMVCITIFLSAATTKFHLIPNGPKKGTYYCNSCKAYFD